MGRRLLAGLMALAGAFLVACVPGSSNATPTAAPISEAATATRSVELTEVAGVRAASGSPASGTAAAGSPASPFIITPPSATPSGTIAAGPATAATGPPSVSTPSAPTAPAAASAAAPTARPTQIVKVQAEDGANVRATPDTNAAILLKADYGAEFPFTELDVPGADGISRWVRVTLPNATGYIRKDLLSEPRSPSPPTPTPDPRTPTAPPAAAPTNTPTP